MTILYYVLWIILSLMIFTYITLCKIYCIRNNKTYETFNYTQGLFYKKYSFNIVKDFVLKFIISFIPPFNLIMCVVHSVDTFGDKINNIHYNLSQKLTNLVRGSDE